MIHSILRTREKSVAYLFKQASLKNKSSFEEIKKWFNNSYKVKACLVLKRFINTI